VKNPTELLIDITRGQWKPAQYFANAAAEFNDWYHKAYAAGLAIRVLRRSHEVWEDWRAIATGLEDQGVN
jgi:hypothetical protein